MDMSQSPFISHNQPGNEGIDFGHYFRLLFHNKFKIAIFVILCTSIAVVLVKPLRNIYEANTTLIIEANGNELLGLPSNDQFSGFQSREYIATQFQIIRSRALMEKIIERLDLLTHPEFDIRQHQKKEGLLSFLNKNEEVEAPPTDEEYEVIIQRNILRDFELNLFAEPVFGTHLLNIHYSSHDPQLSADVVNTLADVYIESYLEANLESTKKATSWLSDRLGELRENLQTAEERLQTYREEEQLVDVQGVRTLDSSQLAQLSEDLIDARQERAAAQTLYEQVKDARNLSSDQLLAIPAVLNNAVVQSVIEAKADADRNFRELSGRYGPKHPNMVAARIKQQEANEKLWSRLSIVTQGIQSNYEAALKTERSIQGQIESARSRLQNVSRKEVRLRELERDVETNRQLYDLFLSRGKEADERSRIEESPARVIDSAVVPYIPVGPNKAKFVIAAFIMSLAMSVGVLILLDLLDTTIRTSEDVEMRLKVPMLGFLPLLRRKKSKLALRIFGRVKSGADEEQSFSEAMRSIRTSLVLSSLEKPFQVILVTSSLPDEGKSTVAINLAEAMGQMEKVLLLDADLRKPSVARSLGIPASTVGLSHVLQGQAVLKDCIAQAAESEMDVISSGVVPQNPLELLGSKRFKEVLSELKKHYDRIIIDSAPVHVVSDAQVLSSQVDSVIYVVRSTSTSSSIASKGIKALQQVKAPLTGIVLNYVDVKKSMQYDSLYGVYAQGYGYSDAK